MEPATAAGQASSNSDEVRSTMISNNEVKRVQAGEVAASVKVEGNFLAGETSSNCLTVDYAYPESHDIIGINKSTSLNVSAEKYNFQQVARLPVGTPVGYSDKKLIILDVNGLLADIVPQSQCAHRADIVISRKAVFKRPFCDDFLQFCFEKFNVGVWSSRIKKNVDKVVDFLMADSRHKLLFSWDQSHCTDTGFTTVENSSKPLVLKELKKLWDKLEPGLPWNKGDYNQSNTLLLDDSPYKALRNPANTAIFPYSYTYKDAGDSSLGPGGDLRVYLEKLADAQNVQEFVAHNPFGQQAITESNPKWDFYQKILIHESREKIASSSGPSYTGVSRFTLENLQYGPQLAPFLQESPALRSGEIILKAPQMHHYNLHHSGPTVYGVPGKISASSRYPTDIYYRNLGLDLPDYGVPRSSTHFNPYASTFEKPLNSRFCSTVFNSNNSDYPSSLSHVLVDEKGLRRPGDDQYDPLLDSIKPSNYVQTREPPGNSDIVPRLQESSLPLDMEENDKKDFGDIKYENISDIVPRLQESSRLLDMEENDNKDFVDIKYENISDIVPRLQESSLPLDMEENDKKDFGDMKYENNNEEFGETEVGDVENGSQGNPDALVHKDTGEMEIDQIKSPGKSKKNIESRSMKLFKKLLANFVKEVLDPSWRRGKMTKESFKSIVKKTVDKVSGSLRSDQVPKSEAKINQYIESSQRKLTKLVMEYVDKHAKG